MGEEENEALTPDPALVRYLAYARTLPGYKPKPPRRYRCRFCGHWTKHRCAWPMVKERRVAVGRLKVGDRVKTGEKRFAEIAFIQRESRLHLGDRDLIHIVLFTDRGDRREWRHPEQGTVVVWLKTRCSAPCCARHRRHPGPGVRYCADHWRAWEQRT